MWRGPYYSTDCIVLHPMLIDRSLTSLVCFGYVAKIFRLFRLSALLPLPPFLHIGDDLIPKLRAF